MTLRDWIGTFGRARSVDLSNELERAYEAALLIQSLELEYYNDRPVRPELALSLPRTVQAQMLRRFRTALQICSDFLDGPAPRRQELDSQELRQLQLIESVEGRYSNRTPVAVMSRSPELLPRSLIGVVERVRRQLDPEAEANVVAGFRRRRDSTLVSLRILLLLVLVPLLFQQVSRTFVISPVVDRLAPDVPFLSYTKPQLEEAAVEKLRIYKAEIEFDALLKGDDLPSPELLHKALSSRAAELKQEADGQSTRAIKNVLSDGVGLLGFVLVCFLGREELRVLRGFLDEQIYGLSDSAKAFAIILFTDIFVGFHSPEGWTVLLDGVSNHLGLPQRENFVLLFIATFPVILATIFKYWIFRYLNRVSPSSVATLRNMNGGG
ncbi:proton extrusion protein PcxA [Synechococcus sp. CS-602]|uniref:proton extrusion protein PcxA n=1 Tax=Synechococcaceae TaxID=1890426 RepID=UPI0008FF3225|nr:MULTISPECIES: proton extrusion protein PcxA [Synechococcaceae]MCT4364207.1 proton extrusion protein PcxA [Candidatus Regnicoccus frigidus MAG-AL1]APD48968.1 proton extrusion protein PcxA [Synechococcus sp. SynAce01]MCT0201103.1 proton extrusion protein PcxA [Synechococcus sp. CS-603]MCT0204596.1 proton extrusion protein PcxA [Synechococcus sp. CS-602]MCT0246346.1 proton extrusion protein PcxA [Synechococcus sp. CS-601]